MNSCSRAFRLIELMRLLNQRCYTTEELAEHFGVSERTIQRDLLDIQGEPLRYPVINRQVWQSMELGCMGG